jgi:hypothetical protein
MAFQMNVNLLGGATASNCYVRVDSVRAFKKDNMSGWKMMIDVYVYKDKAERDKGQGAEMIMCPEVDRFKFDFDPAGADRLENLVAAAYEKLKTIYPFKDKTTDV